MLTFDVDVLGRQLVSPGAMCPGDRDLSGSQCFHVLRRGNRNESAKDIDAGGNGFEVVGIDAAFNPTKMVDLQPFGDRAIGVFVSQTMGRDTTATSAGGDSAVAIGLQFARPFPAPGSWIVDAPVKQFFERCREMLQRGHQLRSLLVPGVGVRDSRGGSKHRCCPAYSMGMAHG